MANIQHEDATPLYDPALQSYRVAVTYWREPATVSEIGREALEDGISHLLDEIHSGRIMAFTIEGL